MPTGPESVFCRDSSESHKQRKSHQEKSRPGAVNEGFLMIWTGAFKGKWRENRGWTAQIQEVLITLLAGQGEREAGHLPGSIEILLKWGGRLHFL